MFFDSHAHYDDDAFSEDRDELLSSMQKAGVCNIINISADFDSCKMSVEIAEKYDFIYSSVGIHPEFAADYKDTTSAEISALAKNPKVVAIGEIGLDYHYENFCADTQKQVFEKQIMLADELNLPIIVHDRDAHGDTIDILKKYSPRGVVHCFSGSTEMLKIILDMGMYISLGGTVTFKNAVKAVEAAKYVPLDRLLIETDAPYLAPVPFRGQRNSSLYIHKTAEKIAEIKGIPTQKIAEQTAENTKKLFNIQ